MAFSKEIIDKLNINKKLSKYEIPDSSSNDSFDAKEETKDGNTTTVKMEKEISIKFDGKNFIINGKEYNCKEAKKLAKEDAQIKQVIDMIEKMGMLDCD